MRIGFIGLGNMGGPMALNVLKAGHTMVVSDIALAEQQLEEALRRGWGERDSNTLFCLQEERAGVTLRTGGR